MAFAAQYPGTCSKCKKPIHKGELIELSSAEYGYQHAKCPLADVVELKLPVINPITLPQDVADSGDNPYLSPEIQQLLTKLSTVKATMSDTKADHDKAREKLAVAKEKAAATKEQEEFLKAKAEADFRQRLIDIEKAMTPSKLEAASEFDHAMTEADKFALAMKQATEEALRLQQAINSALDAYYAEKRREAILDKWDGRVKETPFRDAIKPFQIEGAIFLSEGKRVLLADQMGLGKTLQATAALFLTDPDYSDDSVVLWICPNSIKETTLREIKKWTPDRPIFKLQGNPVMREMTVAMAQQQGGTLIVNYEALNTTPSIYDYTWPRVVMDEAQAFRTTTTKVFDNVERICTDEGTKAVFALTGTPIYNKPAEMWAILHMLDPKRWHSKWYFEQEYCWAYGNEATFRPGAFDNLIKELKGQVLRRRKDEVNIQLPEKVHETRWVEMTAAQRAIYEQMRDRFLIWLDAQEAQISANSILPWLTRLRQLATWPPGITIPEQAETEFSPYRPEVTVDVAESAKVDEAMAIIDELIDDGEKVVVFCTFNAPLEEIRKRVTEKHEGVEVGMITGGQNENKRAEAIESFQSADSKMMVLCGNIKAMGLGYTLHRASNAIFLDKWWAPPVNEQAEDRLHRIGQKNSVTIHYLQAEDSVDAFIEEKLMKKQNMIEGILERDELRKAINDGLI